MVNLRAPYAPFVMAAVKAKLDPAVAQEVACHWLRKGVWSKSLPPGKALLRQHGLLPVDEELPEDVYRSHTLWEILARGLLYSECWQWGINKTKHINILLLQALTLEEKRKANSRPSCRFWAGMGSQVGHTMGLGAIVKGRAASGSFSAVPQQPMPDAIAGDVTVAQCTATLLPIGLMPLRVMHVLFLPLLLLLLLTLLFLDGLRICSKVTLPPSTCGWRRLVLLLVKSCCPMLTSVVHKSLT